MAWASRTSNVLSYGKTLFIIIWLSQELISFFQRSPVQYPTDGHCRSWWLGQTEAPLLPRHQCVPHLLQHNRPNQLWECQVRWFYVMKLWLLSYFTFMFPWCPLFFQSQVGARDNPTLPQSTLSPSRYQGWLQRRPRDRSWTWYFLNMKIALHSFLALTGAQGVTLSVRLSVWHTVVILHLFSSYSHRT